MLRKLLLSKKISDKRAALAELSKKDEDFKRRSEELEQAIEESATEEEQADLGKMVDDLEAEETENENAKKSLEEEIRALEKELEELEAKDEAPVPAPGEDPKERKERKEINFMKFKRFREMPEEQRAVIFERNDVKEFLQNVRSCIAQKRALTNAGLLVPEVFLGLIRENIIEYSKLWKHVNVASISGNGRLVIEGTIPEGIWTECCANLNELDLVFNDVEVDCYKVGGFVPVCNARLEDSDVDLADAITVALGGSIGFALDKAILYGTGVKMPLGVVTRLAQTAAPSNYPATARPWVDLHTKNIKSIATQGTGAALIAEIVKAFGNAKSKYSRGEKVFVMNDSTYTALAAATVVPTADGRLVSAVVDRMPVVGGIIEVLDFIPNNVIIGGFFDLYLLAERRGITLAQSEHAMFTQDKTVFKGTARYDGKPAIAEGFVAIGIEGTTPTAAMTFAPDTANEEDDQEGNQEDTPGE